MPTQVPSKLQNGHAIKVSKGKKATVQVAAGMRLRNLKGTTCKTAD